MAKSSEDKQNILDNNALSEELNVIRTAYRKLQHRHTALFRLNRLSQECTEISSFYTQVHQVIASLMVANNFYIVIE